MNTLARLLINFVLAGLLGFFIYGFIASGEPGVSIMWKIGYGIAGAATIASFALFNRKQSTRKH